MRLDKRSVELIMCKHRLTRQQVADSYGCNVARISTILACQNIRPITAQKFADALGVDVEDIVTND